MTKTITEHELRALMLEHTVTHAAQKLGVSAPLISKLCRKYAIPVEKRSRTREKPGENALIRGMAAQGKSIKAIATFLGRSETFVSDRIDPVERIAPTWKGQTAFRATTDAETALRGALRGRTFEDANVPSAERYIRKLFRSDPTQSGVTSAAALCCEVA